MSFSSQDDPLLLGNGSSSSLSRQTGGAAELQEECCKLQDVIDKMVRNCSSSSRNVALMSSVMLEGLVAFDGSLLCKHVNVESKIQIHLRNLTDFNRFIQCLTTDQH